MTFTEDIVIYQDVFEAGPDPIIIHDADTGTVVRANQAAGALLGCAPDDILGMHVGEFSPPGFSTADANDLIAEAAESGSAEVEWATEEPDGTDRLVEVTLRRTALDDVTIDVTTTVEEGVVTVCLADDGDGVASSEARRIFERGEKGSESGGTGFGLYFVDTMVRSYGGDVWVEDSDFGATFYIELPHETF